MLWSIVSIAQTPTYKVGYLWDKTWDFTSLNKSLLSNVNAEVK